MKQNLWLTLVTYLAYGVDKERWKAIDYLKEQVGVLKEQQEKDKRIALNDQQRMRLAPKAKRLTRRLLEETSVLFTPDNHAFHRRDMARRDTRNENMTVVVGAIQLRIKGDLASRHQIIDIFEQGQLQRRAVPGEHAEINALGANRGTRREASTLMIAGDWGMEGILKL